MEWETSFDHSQGLIRRLEEAALPGSFVLLLTGSYGDIFPNLALLRSFHESTGKPVTVILSSRWSLCAARFSFGFVKYITFPPSLQSQIHGAILNSGRPFKRSPGFLYPLLPTLHPLIADLILTGRVTDYEVKRLILGLEPKAPFFVPELSAARLTKVRSYLLERNIVLGKSVVLAFKTNSNPAPPHSIQMQILNHLQNENLDICINISDSFQELSTKESSEHRKASVVDIPCDAPVETVEMIGGYIGAAHGLTAILATFGDNKVIAQTTLAKPELIPNNGRLINPDIIRLNLCLRDELRNNLIEIVSDLGSAAASAGIGEFVRLCHAEFRKNTPIQ